MTSNKRTLIIVLALIVSISSVGLVAAMIIPSADEILTQSLETLESVESGHAIITATAKLPNQDINGTVELWGKLGEVSDSYPAWRAEILAASEEELVGVIAVTNGNEFWLYNKARNIVVVGQVEELKTLLAEKLTEYGDLTSHGDNWNPESADIPQTPDEFVAEFLKYFTAERKGQEDLTAGQAYLLRLVPIADQMPDELRNIGGFVNLWVRTDDKLPIAGEFAESAFAYGKFEAISAEINIDIDESLFTFDIPPGTQVIEASEKLAELEALKQSDQPLDFEVLTASLLPEAAVAEEPQQVGEAVVQRYTMPEGLSFVVAQGANVPLDSPAEATSSQSVVVRGMEGTLFTNDESTRTLLIWNDGNIWYLVGGDLSPEQALTIAESLQ